MKQFLIAISVLLIVGCADKKIVKDDLKYLNGYWEIEKVEFPDGQTKEYKASTLVDFILFHDYQGMRKKVQPKLDGNYIVSNDDETFKIKQNEEGFSLLYKNGLDEREELLIAIDSLSFTIRNKEGISYFYKRFNPISIIP